MWENSNKHLKLQGPNSSVINSNTNLLNSDQIQLWDSGGCFCHGVFFSMWLDLTGTS